jgi:hypothetical protein
LPYLADVARIERAWTEAYHAPEADTLDPEMQSRVPHDQAPQLCFTLHPSVRIVRSPFPAMTIWRMNVADGVPAPVDLEARGEDTLVARPEANVEVRAIPAGGVEFITALAEGHSLLDAARVALRAAASFDPTAHMTALLCARVFTDCRPGSIDDPRSGARG